MNSRRPSRRDVVLGVAIVLALLASGWGLVPAARSSPASSASATPAIPGSTVAGSTGLSGADRSYAFAGTAVPGLEGGVFTASSGDQGNPPHPTPPQLAPPPYAGHYYTGIYYSAPNQTAHDLSADIQVPDDVPQGGSSNFYYVLLSVWDSAGSYDQIGFANAYGTWGVAYSTTSHCAGTYYYSPDAFALQPGARYHFDMRISNGFVRFAITPFGSAVPVWTRTTYTGGGYFVVGSVYWCGIYGYYDYTDYEEVYYSSGARVPYDFQFTNNTADGTSVTTWSAVSSGGPTIVRNSAGATIDNEPFYLTFPGGLDTANIEEPSNLLPYQWNVTVNDLTPDNPVNLTFYNVPAGWAASLAPQTGAPPYTSVISVTIPSSTTPGAYYLGLNASDATKSGFYSRIAFRVNIGPEYAVSFSETGLPVGTPWSVALATGVDNSTNGTSVNFTVPNGTYEYLVVDVPGYHQSSLPYLGNVTVSGANLAEPTLAFSLVHYALTFSESGLIAGLSWGVNLSGSVETVRTDGGTDQVAFNLTNGSWAYALVPVPGWGEPTIPANGTVVVNGAAKTEPTLAYTAVYAVSFSETGLPAGVNWGIAVSGTTQTLLTRGGTGTLTFLEPNGTHAYTVLNSTGWTQDTLAPTGNLTVAGGPQSEPTLSYFEIFAVVFSESGLPANLSFEVQLGPVDESRLSTGNPANLTFWMPNGSYPFTVPTSGGYGAYPDLGTVGVNGSGSAHPLVYGALQMVSFTPSGLPSNDPWSVTLNGQLVTAVGFSLFFEVPPGTYSFTVGHPPGFAPGPGHGSITVSNAQLNVVIDFVPTIFDVQFAESGLPNGSHWSVAFNGTVHNLSISGPSSGIDLYVPNGSYPFWVATSAPHYVADPGLGVVHIDGTSGGYGQVVTFSPIAPDLTYVQFLESGIPSGDDWQVTVQASRGGPFSYATYARVVGFNLTNGTWDYSIVPTNARLGLAATPAFGTFTVDGTFLNMNVSFRPGYEVQFVETGLPSGLSWTVDVGGVGNLSGAGSSVIADVPNGSYGYSVSSSLSNWTAPGGSVPVAGSDLLEQITFSNVYGVQFNETGIPASVLSRAGWTVAIDGGLEHRIGTSSAFFDVPVGAESYLVTGPAGYVRTNGPASGTVNVTDAELFVQVQFGPGRTYPLGLSEAGLLRGTRWCVDVSGWPACSSHGSQRIANLSAGSYPYAVGAMVGQQILARLAGHGIPLAGTVSVPAASAVALRYTYPYAVTFTESGLANGTNWSVKVGSQVLYSTSSTIVFDLGNGSHRFGVPLIAGYSRTASPNPVRVTGGPASVQVTFRPLGLAAASPSANSPAYRTLGWLALGTFGVVPVLPPRARRDPDRPGRPLLAR